MGLEGFYNFIENSELNKIYDLVILPVTAELKQLIRDTIVVQIVIVNAKSSIFILHINLDYHGSNI